MKRRHQSRALRLALSTTALLLAAIVIGACSGSDTSSPTATVTEVPTPTATEPGTNPSSTVTPSPSATSVSTASPEPTATPTAAGTVVATATADADAIVLRWTREGGIAGFCDGLLLSAGHLVTLGTCEDPGAGAADTDFAPDEAILEFAGWREQYQSFEVEWADGPDIADGMTVRLSFVGRGSAVADEEVQRAIAEFASRLFFDVSAARPRA